MGKLRQTEATMTAKVKKTSSYGKREGSQA